MKKHLKQAAYIFLVALIVCAVSCSDNVNRRLTLPENRGKALQQPQSPQKPSNPPEVPTPPTGEEHHTPPESTPGAEAKKQELFKRLLNAALRFEKTVDVSDLHISCKTDSNGQSECKKLYSDFLDYLDENSLFLFHLPPSKDITYKYKNDNEDETASYELTFLIESAAADVDYQRLIQAFEKFYSVVHESMSQAEISYALYRELQKNIVYEVNSSSQYQRTAAGALLDGKGVCEDYSLSYKKLMNGAGIQTVCVEGKDRTKYTEPTVAHMWNRINLNGQWYNADATWDDYLFAEKYLRSHSKGKYFLTSDNRFYGADALNHPLIYQKYLPVPAANDVRYENADCIFRNGDKKSEPFYHQGYWYYFSYENMSIYRSRFDGSDKRRLYQKMYHTNSDFYKDHYAKLHRIEFGKEKIYFIDYAESHGTDVDTLYAMSYDGSSVQKIGTAPSPSEPLKAEADKPEREALGTFALRVELLLSKLKDAYYHGTEDYFIPENPDRKKFVAAIQKAEKLLQNAQPDAHAARELYTELHELRTRFSMERTSSR